MKQIGEHKHCEKINRGGRRDMTVGEGARRRKLRPILFQNDDGAWLVRAPKGYHFSNADTDDDLPEELDFVFLGDIEKREGGEKR